MIFPVSLVIPIFNEALTLPSLFSGLVAQTMRPAEIIFVDAGSTDGSPQLVEKWWRECAWAEGKCKVLHQPGAYPGAGRNIGIKNTEYEWIAFLDAGIQPEPTWLETLFNYVQEAGLEGAFGVSRFSAETSIAKAICALSSGCGTIHPVLPASIFHRTVFDKVGLFVPTLRAGEDLLWIENYLKIYGSRKICWDAVVNYTFFPTTIWAAVTKWFTYETHAVTTKVGLCKKTVHMLLIAIVLSGLVTNLSFGLPLFAAYVFVRGVCSPINRSADKPWCGKTYSSVIIACVCAVLLDAAKLGGYLVGILKYKRFILSRDNSI